MPITKLQTGLENQVYRDKDIAKILALIKAASGLRSTTLIAIDGLSGAGKSTLVSHVLKELKKNSTISVDDFYRPVKNNRLESVIPEDRYDQYFDWQRLRDTVLSPLTKGVTARYGCHNWELDRLTEWREVNPGGIAIVEGVYSTRPELREFYEVTVYIHTPRVQRLARIIERQYEDTSWVEHWMETEDWYEKFEQPMKHVDLVVQGS